MTECQTEMKSRLHNVARIEPNIDKFSKPHSQEHCSANGNQIYMMGLNKGQQIRIEGPRDKWNNTCTIHDK